MLIGAVLCPATPLLHPEVTGRHAVVPELRAACARAVTRLLNSEPDTVVVVEFFPQGLDLFFTARHQA